MYHAIKYVTIFVSAIVIIFTAAVGFTGGGTESLLVTTGIILFYTAILVFLHKINKRNYKPGYWIAFALAALPVLWIFILLLLYSKGGGC